MKNTFLRIICVCFLILSGQAQAKKQKPPTNEITCLAQAVYYEARGEPLEGKKAVAIVTLNRKNNPKFPSTICGVVYQKGQYSWTRKTRAIPNNSDYRSCLTVAQTVYNEYNTIINKTALKNKLYFSKSVGKTRALKIGNHRFK